MATSASSSTTITRLPLTAKRSVAVAAALSSSAFSRIASAGWPIFSPRGMVRTQCRPPSPHWNLAWPPSCPSMLATMMRVPKPRCAGLRARGPPDSCQCSTSVLGLSSQLTLSRPAIDDRAPYLTALVASSCRASVNVWAEAGCSDTAGQVGALPARMRQHGVGARQGGDAPFDRRHVGRHAVGAGEPHDRLHDRQRVLGAMVDLAGEQDLAHLRFLALGDVGRDAAHPDDVAGRVQGGRRRAEAPADLAVRPPYAELGLVRLALGAQLLHGLLQPRPVVRMNERLHVLGRDHEARRVDPEDATLTFVPQAFAAGAVPVPRTHLSGDQREA